MSDTKLRPEDLTSEERAFNKLTPTQTELLALLSEECGEVVQVIGKILRHGLESCHPNGGPTNRELLVEEIGDCLCASRLLASAGMLNMASVEDRSAAKMEKVFRYLRHARRALFAPEPEKVNCPNCSAKTALWNEHAEAWGTGELTWTCQPAPPAPATPEMPEAVRSALLGLRLPVNEGIKFTPEEMNRRADALETFWRNLAQPGAVGMTEELRKDIEWLVLLAYDKANDHDRFCRNNSLGNPEYSTKLRATCGRVESYVRVQAEQVKRPKFEKVRAFLDESCLSAWDYGIGGLHAAALTDSTPPKGGARK